MIFPELKKNTSFQIERADQRSRRKNEQRPRLKYWLNFRIPICKVSIELKFFTQLIDKAKKLNHSY